MFPAKPASTDGGSVQTSSHEAVSVIASNLKIPWAIAFLSDGGLLVTERTGIVQHLAISATSTTAIPINGVKHIGEGGLLGIVLHPDFNTNHWLYLYLTTVQGSHTVNRVDRYVYEKEKFTDRKTIIENIPGALYHDGGKLAFGPDGNLYVTTGDAMQSNLSQDTNSLAGKVLRVKDDGSIPSDNPFGNAVYSSGHRNSQGLAWDDLGRLWATEHGRSGVLSGFDEINLIEKGKNYGWPVIEGDKTQEGMVAPAMNSGPDVTWAPSGLAYVNGSLFVGGLRGEALYEYVISEKKLITHFKNRFGRIRAVQLGLDGFLYLTTSNTDGRGTPMEGDDKVIRIDPTFL